MLNAYEKIENFSISHIENPQIIDLSILIGTVTLKLSDGIF